MNEVKYIFVGSDEQLDAIGNALREINLPVIRDGRFLGFREEDRVKFGAALIWIFDKRIDGWWLQQNALIEHRVCTAAGFESAYYGAMVDAVGSLNNAQKYRIGYTVGNLEGEHEIRYLDGLFTLAEASQRVDRMNELDAKPGLRGAQLPPSNYFYEISPTDELCPGSGQPTRTNGGCDRCAATDVRGEYKPSEISNNLKDYVGELWDGEFIPPTKFAAMPSMGYYEAKPHKPVKREAWQTKAVSPDDRWRILDGKRELIRILADHHRVCIGLCSELESATRNHKTVSAKAYNRDRRIVVTNTLELSRTLRDSGLDNDADKLDSLIEKVAKMAGDDLTPSGWLDQAVLHADVVGQLESLIREREWCLR